MPIEIREIVINANISSESPSREGESPNPERLEEIKKEIIAECIEKVLVIFQNQKER